MDKVNANPYVNSNLKKPIAKTRDEKPAVAVEDKAKPATAVKVELSDKAKELKKSFWWQCDNFGFSFFKKPMALIRNTGPQP